MMQNSNRITYLDLMRAFAVLMMVQGHTIDTLLSADFRTADSLFYQIWHMMRGFTAPIFMFTSGVVFSYLLLKNGKPFNENERVKKGLKRFFLLVLTGYLLRYPTYKIIDFSNVTERGWRIFYAVDALHLIGFGILFIIGLYYLADRFKIKSYAVFSFCTLIFVLGFFFTKNIEWSEIFPLPLAAYFYKGSGSLFPLFPWAGYVTAGAVLGSWIAGNREKVKTINYSLWMSAAGALLITLYILGRLISHNVYGSAMDWELGAGTILFRFGAVILLNGILSFTALKMKNIPGIVFMLGKNTFTIYVVHLVILYGSAWSIGVWSYASHSLSPLLSVSSALGMITLMTLMIIILERIKAGRQNNPAAA